MNNILFHAILFCANYVPPNEALHLNAIPTINQKALLIAARQHNGK